jgi:hypothetical protein
VANAWVPLAGAGNYAFNDAHAMMAFARAGRADCALELHAAQAGAMARGDDNAAFTREVGRPVVQALEAFAAGDCAQTVALLRPVREIAHRFGGSHAQRDVLDRTLIEAARRSGQTALARGLEQERAALRPAPTHGR